MERTRIICKEMISQRGYKIISDNSEEIIVKKNLKKILIIFCKEDKVSINTVKECLIHMKKVKINHIILIYKGKFTSCAKITVKHIENVGKSDDFEKIIFETFNITELQVNVTKHNLVPKHELTTTEEIKEILKSTVSIDKIPKIYTTDPVCKFYNFKKGDVLRITRKNGFISYRLVIIEN